MEKSLKKCTGVKGMSLDSMDKNYVECCKGYMNDWMKKYDAEEYQISEEVIDEMITIGGEGLHALQTTFRKVIDRAKEEEVEIIDSAFVHYVLENLQ